MDKSNIFKQIALTIALIVVSALFSIMVTATNIEFFLLAVILFIIIGITSYLMCSYFYKTIYELKTKIYIEKVLNPNERNYQFIDYDSILEIEQEAKEVWVYAYDLEWEMKDNPLTDIVYSNLKKGKKYTYIVPDVDNVRWRVEALKKRYAKIRNSKSSIDFHFREEDNKLVQFGFAIFNPSLLKKHAHNTSIVFYPHFKAIDETESFDKFYCISGKETLEIEEAFYGLLSKLTIEKTSQ